MSFKIKSIVVLLVLSCVAGLNAQENSNQSKTRTLQSDASPIIIAVDIDYAPQTFLNVDGQLTGLFVDIWTLWSKKVGKEIIFIPSNWKGTLDNLKNGKTNIHSGLFLSESREKWMDFSRPFYKVGSYLFFSVETVSFDSEGDLSGKRIGAVLGSYQEEYLQSNYSKSEVVPFSDRDKMIRSVLANDIDAFLGEGPAMSAVINRLGLIGKFEKSRNVLFRRAFHAGVTKQNRSMLSLIDKGFDSLTNRELVSIEKRYIKNPQERYFSESGVDIKFSDNEENWLQKGYLVHARVASVPPLHFFDGNYKGMSVDYLNLISKRAGFNVKYVKGISWSDALTFIKRHQTVDLLLTAKNESSRQNDMVFTNDYLLMPWVIYSREKGEYFGTIDDLKNKEVSVERDFVMHKKLVSQFPDIKLVVTDNSKKALEAVATGKADAYIGNLTISNYIIQQNNFNNIKIAAPTPFGNHNQAMAIRNDWPELASIITKTFESMTPEEHAAIRNKWLSIKYEYGISKWDIIKWVVSITLVSLIVLSIIVIWNRRLNSEIKSRILAEKHVKASLLEKETLLQEIHHRVKNNLNVVSSLLKLQENSVEDERVKEALNESQGRIYAMSAVHEALYNTKNLAEIDLKSYLSKISGTLIQTYSVNPGKVRFNIDGDGIILNIEKASPVGLIINELISNSLKYAFQDKSESEINVSMKKQDKQLELIVMDNGIGIQEGFDWKNANTLGLKLVRTLVENQLDGSIDLDNTNGTKFTIKFNIET